MLPLTDEERRQDKLNDHWTELSLGMWEKHRLAKHHYEGVGAVRWAKQKLMAMGVTTEEIDAFMAHKREQILELSGLPGCHLGRTDRLAHPSPSPGPERRYGSNGRG